LVSPNGIIVIPRLAIFDSTGKIIEPLATSSFVTP